MIGEKKRRKHGKQTMVAPARRQSTRRSLKDRLRALVYLAAALLLAGAVWASVQVPRLFTESDRFGLKALQVTGLHFLSGADILEASGLQAGDNVFAVDLEEIGTRIEELPWVKTAVVARRPPDRLAVDIVERRRLAWIDLGEIFGVDAEGVLLPAGRRAEESYRDLDLPVIRGLDCPTCTPGEALADSSLSVLLGWWQQASAADAEFCLNVSEIGLLKPGGIRLRMVGDGLEVRLLADRVPERIRMLKKLMKRIYRECPEPAYIDMRFAGQVVVGSKERNS